MPEGWGLPRGSAPCRFSPPLTATLSSNPQGLWGALALAHPHLISQPPCPHMSSDRPLSPVNTISPMQQADGSVGAGSHLPSSAWRLEDGRSPLKDAFSPFHRWGL